MGRERLQLLKPPRDPVVRALRVFVTVAGGVAGGWVRYDSGHSPLSAVAWAVGLAAFLWFVVTPPPSER